MQLTIILTGLLATLGAAAPTTRHFYTTDPNGEGVRGRFGFGQPGVVAFGERSQIPGTVPLYRCSNGPNQLWLLTTDPSCENSGFSIDGLLMYIYADPTDGGTALDRYINVMVDHMYVPANSYSAAYCDYGYYSREATTGYMKVSTTGVDPVALYGFRKGSNGANDPCGSNGGPGSGPCC